jgi:hypothetical protein
VARQTRAGWAHAAASGSSATPSGLPRGISPTHAPVSALTAWQLVCHPER